MDARAVELLVREVGPADRGDVAALLAGADWPLLELEAWTDGWPGLVLYDPADGVTRGVIVAREIATGTFELVAWAVNGGPDRAAMAERLLRAVADRLRRAGAERLVGALDGADGAAVLAGAGFDVIGAPRGDPTGLASFYQEL